MLNYPWRFVGASVIVLALALPTRVVAQADPYNFKFLTGQDIQPIFEGWTRNPDGSYAMYFGYINRNYAEELLIPVGQANSIEPGGPDRGQPAFFYPRIMRQVFKVTVPKDWGPKATLTWTLTFRGKSAKAMAWLQPEWEIDPIFGGSNRTDESLKNQAPTLAAVDIPSSVAAQIPATLTVTVTDDGLPGPRRASTGRDLPPTLRPLPDQPEIPVNVPAAQAPDRVSGGVGACYCPRTLAATWTLWRGPTGVTFEPGRVAEVKDGKAVVTASFPKPGTYLFRLRASDGALWNEKDVTVTVKP